MGTGGVFVVRKATERREAEEPTRAFARALMRAAWSGGAASVRGDIVAGGDPLRTITAYDGKFAVLSCGDRILRTWPKKAMPRVPCGQCGEREKARAAAASGDIVGPGVASCDADDDHQTEPVSSARATG